MGKVPCWAPELRLPTQEWEGGESLSLGSQQAFIPRSFWNTRQALNLSTECSFLVSTLSESLCWFNKQLSAKWVALLGKQVSARRRPPLVGCLH